MAEDKHAELIKAIEDKLDDHFQALKEDLTKAIEAYLEKTENVFDPEKIKWVQAEGFSGPYERYPAKGEKIELSQDYKALLKWLKEHNGKATYQGYFYWIFQDGATIGRKKRQ
ncbi:hypothetical protein DRO19_00525 [Candidatus Bathyarchaeota archaeon]|nr:MAG: hypothetical protein DRO19_00525 [Candidatus Bathyarchaeota archaeon]